jgi:hypothetical protein
MLVLCTCSQFFPESPESAAHEMGACFQRGNIDSITDRMITALELMEISKDFLPDGLKFNDLEKLEIYLEKSKEKLKRSLTRAYKSFHPDRLMESKLEASFREQVLSEKQKTTFTFYSVSFHFSNSGQKKKITIPSLVRINGELRIIEDFVQY